MHAGRPTHAQLATQRMTTDNNRRRRQTEKAQTFNPVSFVKLTRREKKTATPPAPPRYFILLRPMRAQTHRHTHTRTHAHRSAYFCVHSTRVGHFRVRLYHKCTTGALAHTHTNTRTYTRWFESLDEAL